MPDELIEQQQEFVQWLKDRDMYNFMQPSHTMNCMFQVWKVMKEETEDVMVRPSIDELIES